LLSLIHIIRTDYKIQESLAELQQRGDFFKDAKILGGVKLADIIDGVADLVQPETPKLLSRELPDSLEASFE